MSSTPTGLTWPLIEEARERIAGKVNVTPVLTSSTLDELTGARLFFKCENFQKGGAFKARGATNAVFALPETQARRGVATHSSGNHGAALARAAALRGTRAAQACRRRPLRRGEHVVPPDPGGARERGAASAGGDRRDAHSPLR